MKYSIVIPTLNEEKLLPLLLNQLNQKSLRDKFDFEIIISDGGSTDNTIEIAINRADKIICHSEKYKQTIAEGRNKGAEVAEGNILIFLGADIRISNTEKFFSLIDKTFRKEHIFGMTCAVKIFPEENEKKDVLFHFILNKYFHLLNIIGVGMGRGECLILKRKIFNDVNGFNEKLAAGEDFDLFKRVRKKGQILYSNEITIFESPRRYRQIGYLNILKLWFLNSIFVIFKNRSMNSTWEQIR